MNLFSSKTAKEQLEEKREALCTIIVSKLREDHNKQIEKIKNSEEYLNFEANLLNTDAKAAQLNSAIRAFETAARNAIKTLEGSEYYDHGVRMLQSLSDSRLSREYNYYIEAKREETFPELHKYFDSYRHENLIMAYLRVYDDLKNSDKIVEKVLERLS